MESIAATFLSHPVLGAGLLYWLFGCLLGNWVLFLVSYIPKCIFCYDSLVFLWHIQKVTEHHKFQMLSLPPRVFLSLAYLNQISGPLRANLFPCIFQILEKTCISGLFSTTLLKCIARASFQPLLPSSYCQCKKCSNLQKVFVNFLSQSDDNYRKARSNALWKMTVCSFFYAFGVKEGRWRRLHEGERKQGRLCIAG